MHVTLHLAENDANSIAIALAGGIVAIIAAMNIHSSNPDVIWFGCCALANLAGAACEHYPTPSKLYLSLPPPPSLISLLHSFQALYNTPTSCDMLRPLRNSMSLHGGTLPAPFMLYPPLLALHPPTIAPYPLLLKCSTPSPLKTLTFYIEVFYTPLDLLYLLCSPPTF